LIINEDIKMQEDDMTVTDKASELMRVTSESVSYTRQIPASVGSAIVEDGILQITPDLEQAITEVDRGEVVSMNEFKTIFAKWID
jgi:hypothetical protein